MFVISLCFFLCFTSFSFSAFLLLPPVVTFLSSLSHTTTHTHDIMLKSRAYVSQEISTKYRQRYVTCSRARAKMLRNRNHCLLFHEIVIQHTHLSLKHVLKCLRIEYGENSCKMFENFLFLFRACVRRGLGFTVPLQRGFTETRAFEAPSRTSSDAWSWSSYSFSCLCRCNFRDTPHHSLETQHHRLDQLFHFLDTVPQRGTLHHRVSNVEMLRIILCWTHVLR